MHTAVTAPDSKLGYSAQRPVDRIATRRQGLNNLVPIQFMRAKGPMSAYAPNQQLKSLHLITYPHAGRRPHRLRSELGADVIASFVRNI